MGRMDTCTHARVHTRYMGVSVCFVSVCVEEKNKYITKRERVRVRHFGLVAKVYIMKQYAQALTKQKKATINIEMGINF